MRHTRFGSNTLLCQRTGNNNVGMLNSKGKVTYGYFEARIKGAHVFRGTYPAFWLYSLPGDGKKIKPQKENTVVYNEIDIIELQQVHGV